MSKSRLNDDLFLGLEGVPTDEDTDLGTLSWPTPNKDAGPVLTKIQPKQSLIRALPTKHPSWRVYRALTDLGIDVTAYGLKDVAIYYPMVEEDPMVTELKNLFAFVETFQKEHPGEVIDFNEYQDTLGIIECYQSFLDNNMRSLLECLLLTGSSIVEILSKVDCDEEFLINYKTFFYDVSVFKDDRDRMQYIVNCTSDSDRTAKKMAKEGGIDYVITSNGLGAEKVDITALLQNAFCRAYQKMVDFSDNQDLESQEIAQGWGNLLVKTAAQIKTNSLTSGNSGDDYKVKLQQKHAPTVGIGDLK